MAAIPFLKETVKTGQAPGPKLDTLRRPSYSADRQVAAIGRLADSATEKMLSDDPYVAEANAMGRLGESVFKAGGIIQAVAMEREKALREVEMTKARAAWSDMQYQIRGIKETKHPLTWKDEIGKLADSTNRELLANKLLTPGTRAEMEFEGRLLRDSLLKRSDVDSTTTIFKQAGESHLVEAAQAYAYGNDQKGNEIILKSVKDNYLPEHVGKAKMIAGEQIAAEARLKKEIDFQEALILGDARDWERNEKTNTEGLSVDAKMRLRSLAYSQGRRQDYAVADAFADQLARGEIKSEDGVRKALAGMPDHVVKDGITQYHTTLAQDFKEKNNRPDQILKNYGDLSSRIAKLDTKDPKYTEKMLQLRWDIGAYMSGDSETELKKRLSDKNDPDVRIDPTDKKYALDEFQKWRDEGTLGDFRRNAVPGDAEWRAGVVGPQPLHEVPEKRQEVNAKLAMIEKAFLKWLGEQPSPPGTLEVKEQMGKIAADELSKFAISKRLADPVSSQPAPVDMMKKIKDTLGIKPTPMKPPEKSDSGLFPAVQTPDMVPGPNAVDVPLGDNYVPPAEENKKGKAIKKGKAPAADVPEMDLPTRSGAINPYLLDE